MSKLHTEEESNLVRNKIVSAGIRIARESGLASVLVSEVAREAKVSVGTLYNHFMDSYDLQEAVIDQYGFEHEYHHDFDSVSSLVKFHLLGVRS